MLDKQKQIDMVLVPFAASSRTLNLLILEPITRTAMLGNIIWSLINLPQREIRRPLLASNLGDFLKRGTFWEQAVLLQFYCHLINQKASLVSCIIV